MVKLERVDGSLIELAHKLISGIVKAGDTVVDATIGNGHDTLFLARCVGSNGRVIGFDVQAEALKTTSKRLMEAGIAENLFELYSEGHQNMKNHVQSGVAAVMFNLGYLPGSDKRKITRTETSLEALQQSMACLEAGGMLSVMCYPGHAGGDSESLAVSEWIDGRNHCFESVTYYRREGASESSPFLITAIKRHA